MKSERLISFANEANRYRNVKKLKTIAERTRYLSQLMFYPRDTFFAINFRDCNAESSDLVARDVVVSVTPVKRIFK